MDGYLPSIGGLPANPRMVTHHKKVFYRHGIWQWHETNTMDGHLPSLGGSPANPRMVTHLPKDGHPNWSCLAPFGPVWYHLDLVAMF